MQVSYTGAAAGCSTPAGKGFPSARDVLVLVMPPLTQEECVALCHLSTSDILFCSSCLLKVAAVGVLGIKLKAILSHTLTFYLFILTNIL